MAAIVSLLTDFGVRDTYVGQMKAVMSRIAPGTALIDLTHEVPAQDVQTGAFLLMTAVEAFGPDTVHLAVVDPGVGSSRRAVAVQCTRGDVFVGPDNGLLVPAVERLGGAAEIVDISGAQNWGARHSTTFHGRDLFAPVAARIAAGESLSSIGSPIEALSKPFVLPIAHARGALIEGRILHVDVFGNLVTNIRAELLPERFTVRVGEATISGAPHSHYGAVGPGQLLALVGSAGYLEISARDASASLRTASSRGDLVIVEAC